MTSIPVHNLSSLGPHKPETSFLDRVSAFFAIFGAAVRVSNAVDAGVKPDKADLKVLGLEGFTPSIGLIGR